MALNLTISLLKTKIVTSTRLAFEEAKKVIFGHYWALSNITWACLRGLNRLKHESPLSVRPEIKAVTPTGCPGVPLGCLRVSRRATVFGYPDLSYQSHTGGNVSLSHMERSYCYTLRFYVKSFGVVFRTLDQALFNQNAKNSHR